MIPLTLAQVAEVTGGVVHGDGRVVVDAPVAVDSRLVEPGGLFAAIAGEHVDGHEYAAQALAAGAAAVIASRPVDAPTVVVDDVAAALGLLARFVLDEVEDITVVALTGSSGKTSVKDLVQHVLEPEGVTVATAGNHNNELGVPLTVLRADELTRFLVVEMGARHIGDITHLCTIAPPDIAMVLNVGRAHVGEFGSTTKIAEAKGELVAALGEDGVAVLNADDPLVMAMATRTVGTVVTFGRDGDVAVGPVTVDEQGQPSFSLSVGGQTLAAHVPQIGEYHAFNAAAAAAAATAAGVDPQDVVARLATATPHSAMRMERTVRADGLVVVNDAYNANPESMAAALRAVAAIGHGRAVAVLGEMLELGDESQAAHVDIGRLAADLGFSRVIAVGEGASGIAEGAGAIAEVAADVGVATRTLSASLSGDEVVLVKASRGGQLERVAHALLHD